MTKLFERAVETVRSLPPETQDALARIVLQLAQENDLPPIVMSVEDETSFEESLAEAERGEFVSDEAIRAFWSRHPRTSSLWGGALHEIARMPARSPISPINRREPRRGPRRRARLLRRSDCESGST